MQLQGEEAPRLPRGQAGEEGRQDPRHRHRGLHRLLAALLRPGAAHAHIQGLRVRPEVNEL